ncbi:MAG: radical SAM protein [Planctomycetaceae bacterium]
MIEAVNRATQKFHVEIVKPSHYDDDGYVIQWRRAFIPSNSLACLWAIATDAQQRGVLGDDVEIVLNGYDETHTVIPVDQIVNRIRSSAAGGIVLLAGVQSNQFPRAADLAARFRAGGVDVAIGGFHVSGCLSMLPELPPEIKAVQEQGVILFAGEAEGTLEGLLKDAFARKLQPVYNYLLDLPGLEGQVTPFVPPEVTKKSFNFAAFDAGRGCPFRCSFCTIINVQGRKSRYRSADDVEKLVRTYATKGVNRFFITDDNMARNKNWEEIFDRLIHLRETEGIKLRLLIQVDTQCHKIPGFIEKAARAGCNRVFIGMESVSPENLAAAKKYQNNILEYRRMLQEWRKHGVLTHAGYILGFPADTPESIERDIQTIQRELPIDILEFFVLTPLPGSADHRDMAARGDWMNPDMNLYDSEHVTTHHPKMTAEEWQGIYDRAWHLYYTPEHIETMIRRCAVSGCGPSKMMDAVMMYYGSYRHEGLHPLQCGIMRRKERTSRRPGMTLENPLLFYPRRVWEIAKTHLRAGLFYLDLIRTRRKVMRDPQLQEYMDDSLRPVPEMIEEPACESGCATSPADPGLIPLTIPNTPLRKRSA